jgi:hypothetical protein|tara:strand:- start:399 stop:617 length:219 start_codon:yes stop_codon:yes gene_type:complete
MKNNCNPKWKQWCIACCSSQLWILPAFLLGVFIWIEGVHTKAHLDMEIDVHRYCADNAEYQKKQEFAGDDEW